LTPRLDIFGFFEQTLQGADIMSSSDPEKKCRVFIPDFFEGHPADISWYPPQTEEQKQNLGNFFKTQAVPGKALARIPGILEEANKLAEGINGFKDWAIVGYCWGGKIAALAAGKDSPFQAAVQCHPAMLDSKDALNVKTPMAILASKDEATAEVQAYKENLDKMKIDNLVVTFPTQIHGWMAARGDLSDPEVKREYENGYKTVLAFLHEHM
jgi:dienelactone hydrolase